MGRCRSHEPRVLFCYELIFWWFVVLISVFKFQKSQKRTGHSQSIVATAVVTCKSTGKYSSRSASASHLLVAFYCNSFCRVAVQRVLRLLVAGSFDQTWTLL